MLHVFVRISQVLHENNNVQRVDINPLGINLEMTDARRGARRYARASVASCFV